MLFLHSYEFKFDYKSYVIILMFLNQRVRDLTYLENKNFVKGELIGKVSKFSAKERF